jgi:hypothetical protein
MAGRVLDVDRHRGHVDDLLPLLGQVVAVVLSGDLEVAPPEGVHDRDQQLAGPERRDEVAVDPEAERLARHFRVVLRGEQDDGGAGMVAADLLR